jgi:transcriptional regulator with XRE-family HTH domain
LARIEAGFTQSQFAELLGVSVRTLLKWERGRRQPTGAAKTLIKIREIAANAGYPLQSGGEPWGSEVVARFHHVCWEFDCRSATRTP